MARRIFSAWIVLLVLANAGWSMTTELASRSILSVAQAPPDAEAIVVTGAGTRTLEILAGLEAHGMRCSWPGCAPTIRPAAWRCG